MTAYRVVGMWILAAACLGGCQTNGPGTGTPADTSVLVIGRGNDSLTLDPAEAEDGESMMAIVNLYDYLIDYDEQTADLVPGLAESWTESEDRLSWTFKLRDGVKFHDGNPVDAAAVKFTLDRIIDEKHPHYAVPCPYRTEFGMIESVEIAGPLEVTLRLNRPSGVLLRNLSMFVAGVVSPKAVEAAGEEFTVKPVGSGPYRFESWRRDEALTLKANADYWRGPPSLQTVILRPIPDSAARRRQLATGEIDMADNLATADRQAVRDDPKLELLTAPGMTLCYLSLNCTKPPFDKLEVRQALAHAIDKQAILAGAYDNEGATTNSMVPPTMWGFAPDLPDYAYDPERAKRLLAEHGVKPGTKLRFIAMPNPRPYVPLPDRVAQIIQEQLRQVGFEPQIEMPSWQQYLDQVGNGEHDLCLSGWTTDNADPDNFLFALLSSANAVPPNANNRSFYTNPELDSLLANAQRESHMEPRRDLYLQAQQIIARDVPTIPLIAADFHMAVRRGLKGYVVHPTGIVRLRNVRFETVQ